MSDASTLDELLAARVRQDDTMGAEIRRGVEQRLFGDRAPDLPASLGRLELRERIGSGAHGEVYRAHDPLLDRDVAVKLLHRRLAVDEDGQARLRREARALAAITHPNVVALYDAAIHQDAVYVVMELVEGRDLAVWLREQPRGWRRVLAIFIELADGLDAVHCSGLVHRDVKPANVLVDRSERPRLADFGLSALSAALPGAPSVDSGDVVAPDLGRTLTRTGAVVGTPAYMAPEQHDGADVDARADQYAFFVALWEALYGARPFSGRGLPQLVDAKHRGPPRKVVRRGVPRRVHAAIERGLQPDPAARYSDMRTAASALRRAGSRRDRTLVGVGVLACGAIAAAAWPRSAACRTGSTRASELWQGQRREVEASLTRTGLPYAETTFRRIDADVEAWASAWASAWDRACADERSSGSSRAAAQMRCLDAALGELHGLTNVLVLGDARFVASAVDATQGIPPVDRCDEAASASFTPAVDDDDATAVADVRMLLGRARHLTRAAMLDEADDALAAADARAADVHTDALELELELARTELELVRNAEASAVQRMEALAWQATAADRPDLATDAMLALAGAYAGERAAGPAEDGLAWIDRVAPFIARLGDAHADARSRLYHSALAGYVGDYATKLALAQSVLDLSPELLSEASHLRGTAWAGIGTALRLSGRHHEARHAYEQALAQQERTLGPDHPATVTALVGLANLATLQRDASGAQQLLERALAIATAAWGEHDIRAVRIRNDLGNVALVREDFAAALVQYDLAYRALEAAVGLRHASTAQAALNRGNALALLGRLDEAEADLRDAVGTLEALGEHPSHLAGAHVRLGDLLMQRDRVREAGTHYQTAVDTVIDAGGASDLLVEGLSGLARVASQEGEHTTAAEHQRRIVELREQASREHASPTSRAIAFVNLAITLVELGELDEAGALLDRAEPLLPEPRDALATRVFGGIQDLRAKVAARAPRPPSVSTARDRDPPPRGRP